jgi:hypothetical protein
MAESQEGKYWDQVAYNKELLRDLEDVIDQFQRDKITKTQALQTLRDIVKYENLRPIFENDPQGLLNVGVPAYRVRIKENS